MKARTWFISGATSIALIGVVRVFALETAPAVAAVEPAPAIDFSDARTSEHYVSPSQWADAHGSFHDLDEEDAATPELTLVDTGAIFLRSAPDRDADMVRIIPSRKRIALLDDASGDWLRAIDLETGAFGWVSSNFFTPPEETPKKRLRAKKRPAAVEAAIIAPKPVEAKPEAGADKDEWGCPCR